MKSFKQIIGLSLAIIFTLVLSGFPVTAGEPETPKLEITVDEPHSFNGQTINSYLIFQLMSDTDGYVYELNDSFKDFESDYSVLLGGISLIDFLYDNAENETALISIRNALNEYIIEKNTPAETIFPDDTVSFSGKTIDDTPERRALYHPETHGLYFITGNISLYGNPDDATPFKVLMNTDYGQNAEGLPGNTGTLNLNTKIDVPTITKTADKNNESFGGIITFTLNTAVPRTAGFEGFVFNIKDTMSAGLTFNDDIAITVGGVIVTEGVEYTLDNVTDRGFTIVFDSDAFLTFVEGAEIEVNYTATLNEDAVTAPRANINSVVLEYSNDPEDWRNTTETPPDEEKVYTFEIVIFKYTGDFYRRTPMSGVTFYLEPTDRGLWSTDWEGRIIFSGLAAGTYLLYEEDAPAGYTTLIDPIEIAISEPDENGNYTYTVDKKPQGTKSQVDVQNNRSSWLPGTGGIGVTPFYIGGAIIIGGVILLLIVRSKKSGK